MTGINSNPGRTIRTDSPACRGIAGWNRKVCVTIPPAIAGSNSTSDLTNAPIGSTGIVIGRIGPDGEEVVTCKEWSARIPSTGRDRVELVGTTHDATSRRWTS
eukprot:2671132-Rhodomonas_salina.3